MGGGRKLTDEDDCYDCNCDDLSISISVMLFFGAVIQVGEIFQHVSRNTERFPQKSASRFVEQINFLRG